MQSCGAQFKTVLIDTEGMFPVVVYNARGLGVLGSVHLAQRSNDLLYNQRLVQLIQCLQQTPVSSLIVGGDWNWDIRTHKLSTALIKFLQAAEAFMQGRVRLPRDFCILKGVWGQWVGMWLREMEIILWCGYEVLRPQ